MELSRRQFDVLEALVTNKAVLTQRELEKVTGHSLGTINKTVKELNDLGKTIIMIEHNMEEISRLSDRIILLDQGKILADDTTEKVMTNTDLMNQLNFFPPEVTQLFVALDKKGIHVDHFPLTVESGVDALKDVLKKA